MKKKTSEYITIVLLNGKKQKRFIYLDDNGEKYVYNQGGFWKLGEFVKSRRVV